MTQVLPVEPLTSEGFAAFGDVIETRGAENFQINEGTTTRFHQLATPEAGPDGRAIISIFRGTRRPDPIAIHMLERHPLGSQAFFPLTNDDWLIVVADQPESAALRCFRASGRQGVQYAAGTWHHPLLVLAAEQDFLIVDRDGPGSNLDEVMLEPAAKIVI